MVPAMATAQTCAKQLKFSSLFPMGKDSMHCQNFAVDHKAGFTEK